MTASVLKQDANTRGGVGGGGGKKDAIYYDKTQYANFRDRPLFQATKKLLGQAPFSMFFGLYTYAKKQKTKQKTNKKQQHTNKP